jgi:hypothetical protein
MKFDGPQHKNGLCRAQTYLNYRVALGSLMARSSRFTNLGMMEPIRFGSMGIRRSMNNIVIRCVHLFGL